MSVSLTVSSGPGTLPGLTPTPTPTVLTPTPITPTPTIITPTPTASPSVILP